MTTKLIDVPPADKPPKRGPGRPKADPKLASYAQIKEAVEGAISLGGIMLSSVDQVCGPVIVGQAEPTADALVSMAKKNPRLRRALSRFTVASSFAELAAALMPVVLTVGAHHGLIPDVISQSLMRNVETAESNGHGTFGME